MSSLALYLGALVLAYCAVWILWLWPEGDEE